MAVNTLPRFVGCSYLLTRTINCTRTSDDTYNVRREERKERMRERERERERGGERRIVEE